MMDFIARVSIETELFKLHNPELLNGPEQMVCQVWEDGELTLQKCGELLHQRGLHQIWPPYPELGGTFNFPLHMYGHTCVVVPFAEAEAIIKEMWSRK